MRQYIDTLQDVNGNALVGATVLVQNYVGGANAAIFSDNGLTPILTSTVASGADGQFSFFAADGDYNLVLSKNATVFKTQSPVSLFDGAAQVTQLDIGSVNALATSSSVLEKALRTGLRTYVKVAVTCTGAATLSYNGLAVKAIINVDGSSMTAGELQGGGIYLLEYNGTAFQLASYPAPGFFATTPAETAAGVTPSNPSYPSYLIDGYVWLARYGGAESATAATNDAAFAAAAAVAQQINGLIGITDAGGIWNFNTAWAIGATVVGGGPPAIGIVGFGFPHLQFNTIGSTTDCITVGGPSVPFVRLANLAIYPNACGQDGLVLAGANHCILENIYVSGAVRDAYALSVTGVAFIEKGQFDIRVQSAGRHGLRIQTAGTGGAYVNECVFNQLEVRGCARLTAGGVPIYVTGVSTAASTVSEMLFLKTNLDVQYNSSAPITQVPGNYFCYCDSGSFQAPTFIAGGWENTGNGSAANIPAYLVGATGTCSLSELYLGQILLNASGLSGIGTAGSGTMTVAYWSDLRNQRTQIQKLAAIYTQPMVVEDFQLFENVNSEFYSSSGLKKLRHKTSVPSSQTDGIPLDGTLHAEATIATSSSGNMLFPQAITSPISADFTHSFILVLTTSQFNSSGNIIMRGYHLMVRWDLATVVAYQIWDNSSANELVSVAFSIVSTTTLQAAITTGTAHALGGANGGIYGTLFRGAFTR